MELYSLHIESQYLEQGGSCSTNGKTAMEDSRLGDQKARASIRVSPAKARWITKHLIPVPWTPRLRGATAVQLVLAVCLWSGITSASTFVSLQPDRLEPIGGYFTCLELFEICRSEVLERDNGLTKTGEINLDPSESLLALHNITLSWPDDENDLGSRQLRIPIDEVEDGNTLSPRDEFAPESSSENGLTVQHMALKQAPRHSDSQALPPPLIAIVLALIAMVVVSRRDRSAKAHKPMSLFWTRPRARTRTAPAPQSFPSNTLH